MEYGRKHFRCMVITPEAEVLDAEVHDVVFAAHDGLRGVLPDHGPLLCNLGVGLLYYRDSQDVRHRIFIEKGVGHIRENEAIILTRRAITSEQVSEAEARSSLRRAEALTSATIEDVKVRRLAIERAKLLIRLTEPAD